MPDWTRPVRAKNAPDFRFELLGTVNKQLVFKQTKVSTGEERVAYRHLDGKHPNGYWELDLVNTNEAGVASAYHTMDSDLAKALKTLWSYDQWGAVFDVVRGIHPELQEADIRSYFSALWS